MLKGAKSGWDGSLGGVRKRAPYGANNSIGDVCIIANTLTLDG